MGLYALSYLAGLLTVLSPCVLPVLPIIVASSFQKHITGPLFVALGLIISFSTTGWILSRTGHFIGLTSSEIKTLAAVAFIIFGLILLITPLHSLFSKFFSSLENHASRWSLFFQKGGLIGQFFLGMLLGLIWTPCVGPTLGAAVSFASTQENGLQAFLMMFLFSVGSATPLMVIAYFSKWFFKNHQQRILKIGDLSRKIMGGIFFALGIFLILGWDKIIETYILKHMPDGWLELITRF